MRVGREGLKVNVIELLRDGGLAVNQDFDITKRWFFEGDFAAELLGVFFQFVFDTFLDQQAVDFDVDFVGVIGRPRKRERGRSPVAEIFDDGYFAVYSNDTPPSLVS